MLQMLKSNNEPEFKDSVIRLYLEERSITQYYPLGKGTLRYWLGQRCEECPINPVIKDKNRTYEEINHLCEESSEIKKENKFLKKCYTLFDNLRFKL